MKGSLVLASALLIAGSAAAAVRPAGPPVPLPARTVPASVGVSETTAQIMARPAPPSVGSPLAVPEPELDRGGLAQNPESPHTAGARTATVGGPSILNLGLNFTGVTLFQGDNACCVPPDSMGAVGPSQYVVAVNELIRSFSKATGAADGVLNTGTNAFFASKVPAGQVTTDPRVRFDALSGRWFVTMISAPTNGAGPPDNRIMIAVSNGGTITNSTVWTFFSWNSDSGCLADFDTLGIDASALYIGVNDFCGATLNLADYTASKAYVVQKSSVLGAGPALVHEFTTATSGGGGAVAPQGVDNPSGDSTQGYFVGSDESSFGKLDVVQVSSPGTSSPTATEVALSVPATDAPLSVPSLGAPRLLDAVDDRLTTSTLRNGTLWTAQNIGVNSGGVASSPDRDGIRWYALTNLATTPSLSRSGTVFDSAGSNPLFEWMPALTVSAQGHVALGMSTAGTSAFTNAAYATMLAGDSAFSPPVAYTASSSSYDDFSTDPQRWGDFSNTSVDPCDGQTFWAIDEFAANSVFGIGNWGVQVAKILAPPPATPSAASPTFVPAGMSSVGVQLTGTSSGGSAFFNGVGNPACRLSASVTPGVTVNSTSFVDGTHLNLSISTAGAVAGPKLVAVTNPDGQTSAGVALAVLGSLAVNPNVGFPGAAATVSGASFAPAETVNLTWWGCSNTCQQLASLGSATANGAGAFTKPITIPMNSLGGVHYIVANGATSGGIGLTAYNVLAVIQANRSSAHPGDHVQVSGSLFAPNESVGLSWWQCGLTCTNLASLGTATADSNGAFSGQDVTVPAGAPGTYFIVGIGASSGAVGLSPFTLLSMLSAVQEKLAPPTNETRLLERLLERPAARPPTSLLRRLEGQALLPTPRTRTLPRLR